MHNIIFAYYHSLCNLKGTNLSLVDDNRFIELTVEKDCELKTFIEDHNIKFVRGAAFMNLHVQKKTLNLIRKSYLWMWYE